MQEVCFGHNFEIPVKHPSGDFKQAVEYMYGIQDQGLGQGHKSEALGYRWYLKTQHQMRSLNESREFVLKLPNITRNIGFN